MDIIDVTDIVSLHLALHYCTTYYWAIIGIHGRTQICWRRGSNIHDKNCWLKV